MTAGRGRGAVGGGGVRGEQPAVVRWSPRRAASRGAVESEESSQPWCGAAAAMAGWGGWRGRGRGGRRTGRPTGVQRPCEQLADRPRPADRIPHDEVADRPDSSSFPSGHTAAAVAFTAAPTWPAAGALRAVPTALVAVKGCRAPTNPVMSPTVRPSAWPLRDRPRPQNSTARQTCGWGQCDGRPARTCRAGRRSCVTAAPHRGHTRDKPLGTAAAAPQGPTVQVTRIPRGNPADRGR